MESGAAALLRDPGGTQRVTLFELFFDLVFVGALAVTSMTLTKEVTWLNAAHTVIVLTAVWWVWSITAIVTDFYNPERVVIQVLLLGVMLGTIILAVAIPGAFDGRGIVFASTYVGIHLGRGVLLVSVLRGHVAQQRAARFMFWFGVSAIPWLVGAFQDDRVRTILWAVALTIDLVSNGFRYPTPMLGRVPLRQYARAREHLGERYQQFMILALGDIILVVTLGYSAERFTLTGTLSVVVPFGIGVLLWQAYVRRAGALLLTSVIRRPGRAVRWAPYSHLIMVTGTVLTSTANELMIIHPLEELRAGGLGLTIGGPFLFLIGRMIFEYQVFGRIARSRLVWPILLAVVAPVLANLSHLGAAAVVLAILVVMTVAEWIRDRRHRVPGRIRVDMSDHPGQT